MMSNTGPTINDRTTQISFRGNPKNNSETIKLHDSILESITNNYLIEVIHKDDYNRAGRVPEYDITFSSFTTSDGLLHRISPSNSSYRINTLRLLGSEDASDFNEPRIAVSRIYSNSIMATMCNRQFEGTDNTVFIELYAANFEKQSDRRILFDPSSIYNHCFLESVLLSDDRSQYNVKVVNNNSRINIVVPIDRKVK